MKRLRTLDAFLVGTNQFVANHAHLASSLSTATAVTDNSMSQPIASSAISIIPGSATSAMLPTVDPNVTELSADLSLSGTCYY
jgi:hypothetical protein